MTTTTTTPERTVGTWTLTWHGIRTVTALELRQRVRSSRWKIALTVWFLLVAAITLLAFGALLFDPPIPGEVNERGVVLGVIVSALVLGLGLLVTPTLTSTSVNGDRGAGTLATLQVTLLSPAEIALGKLLAAWLSACAFLLVSLPFYVLALLAGGLPVATLPRVLLLTALLLAAVCGIGLGWSTIAARPAGSTVLTFVTVAALTIFSPVFFGLTYPFLSTYERVQVYGVPDSAWEQAPMDADEPFAGFSCEITLQEREVARTDLTWWLLAVNPFVIVADGALPPGADDGRGESISFIRESSQALRELRLGPPEVRDECFLEEDALDQEERTTVPIWPFGLAFDLLLGAAGFVVAVRRLRIPQRKLARGTRVA